MVKPVRRPSRKDSAFLKNADHVRLWNLVEGAVVDAFRSHPDYLTDKGSKTVVRSVTKRVVGQIVGHAKQTLRGGRFGDCRGRDVVLDAAPDPDSCQGSGRGGQTPPDRPDLQTSIAPSAEREFK